LAGKRLGKAARTEMTRASEAKRTKITHDFIALLKDSSLVSIVTLTELTKTYTTLANSTRDHLGLGLLVALCYLLVGLPFARLARVVEARFARHLKREAT
jgi:polar amino acid transport system substrate-binding protein